MKQSRSGFTIVELLIVIVVIAILATISIVAYRGIQVRARDTLRIDKVNKIARAIELYKVDSGGYPAIPDGNGQESTSGSQTENWGHNDRLKILTDILAPYMTIDPTSLSNATQGNQYYYYTSLPANNHQSYGLMVYLEGTGGQNDGGYYTSAYEVGPDPTYCLNTYAGGGAAWRYSGATTRCHGGN